MCGLAAVRVVVVLPGGRIPEALELPFLAAASPVELGLCVGAWLAGLGLREAALGPRVVRCFIIGISSCRSFDGSRRGSYLS